MKIKKRLANYFFKKLSGYYVIQKKIKLRYYYYLHSDVLVLSANLIIGSYFNISILDKRKCQLIIQDGVVFRNYCNLFLMGQGHLTIESDAFFNNFCSINCLGNIHIGENSIFGENVKMYDHNHTYAYSNNGDLNIERQKFNIGAIKIGKNCWIGSNVTILNNVEIGDNVIIGANCLVYKSILSNTIVRHKEELVINSRNDLKY